MSEVDKIKDRITKLKAKAEGTDNAAEADLFMQKVVELLDEHQLKMHDLGDPDDFMGEDKDVVHWSTSTGWKRHLLIAVAYYYNCYPFWARTGRSYSGHIIGRKSARVTFMIMYPYIFKQIGKQAATLIGSSSANRRAVANAMSHRLRLLAQDKIKKHENEKSKYGAMIIRDENEAFRDELYNEFTTTKLRKTTTTLEAWQAASKINISEQINYKPGDISGHLE